MFQDIFDAIIAGQVDVIIAVFFIGLVMILARRLGVSYWIPLIATVILLVAAYFIRSYFTGVP